MRDPANQAVKGNRRSRSAVGGRGRGLIYLLDSRYTAATAALNPGPRNAGVMMNCQY